MKCSIKILQPSENIGFVEYKRSFTIEGSFETDFVIPDNANLLINLLDENDNIVRYIKCDKKNKPFPLYYDGLTCYKEELDPNRNKLLEFGFPVLMVNDLNNIEKSIHNGCIKLWYSDKVFKGVITSSTNIENGAIFDDGMNFVNENGEPYKTLPIGKYKIEVILSFDNYIFKEYKNIIIDKRKEQFICRFNPLSHKERMIEWCKENNISIIKDLCPGYLEPYLGTWYYHMGMLKMYRANDICLYDDVPVIMFVYLIDKTSTSYETELAYLQTKEKVNDVRFYHYDIGEAIIDNRKAKTIEFDKNEYIYLCRIDYLIDESCEGVYNLNRNNVIESTYDFENIKANSKIAIMGIVKPYQQNLNDFILKDDNTYNILNKPEIIRYTFVIDGKEIIEDRKLNMERIDDVSIGTSVYEFYNIFNISNNLINKQVNVKVECIDKLGNYIPFKIEKKVNFK